MKITNTVNLQYIMWSLLENMKLREVKLNFVSTYPENYFTLLLMWTEFLEIMLAAAEFVPCYS